MPIVPTVLMYSTCQLLSLRPESVQTFSVQ